jgi:hypothetical protein
MVATRAHMHLPIVLQQVFEELVCPPGGVSHPRAFKATAASKAHRCYRTHRPDPAYNHAAAVAHILYMAYNLTVIQLRRQVTPGESVLALSLVTSMPTCARPRVVRLLVRARASTGRAGTMGLSNCVATSNQSNCLRVVHILQEVTHHQRRQRQRYVVLHWKAVTT